MVFVSTFVVILFISLNFYVGVFIHTVYFINLLFVWSDFWQRGEERNNKVLDK